MRRGGVQCETVPSQGAKERPLVVSFPCLWPGPDRSLGAVPGPVPVAGARRPAPAARGRGRCPSRCQCACGRARLALAVAAAKARRGWALRTASEPARRQQPPTCMPTRRSGVGTFNGLKRRSSPERSTVCRWAPSLSECAPPPRPGHLRVLRVFPLRLLPKVGSESAPSPRPELTSRRSPRASGQCCEHIMQTEPRRLRRRGRPSF